MYPNSDGVRRRSPYEGLKNLGFESGKILEPAMGIGNFFGTLPEEMRNSKLYGVELDSLTGRIAQAILTAIIRCALMLVI